MQKRKLGKSNLEVSAIGFGCMGLNFSYSHALTKEESIALIRQAVDLGRNQARRGRDSDRGRALSRASDGHHRPLTSR
jgi:predicted aldo/keto reductase-like oxidoreductase